MSRRLLTFWIGILLFSFSTFAQLPSAEEALARSIAYHDPSGQWPTFSETLVFEQTRPDGPDRHIRVTLDLPNQRFVSVSERDGRTVEGVVAPDSCGGVIDDQPPTADEAQEYRLGCEALTRTRDYYTYLWGLPMKLRDPGTQLHPEVEQTTFQGTDVLALRVTYDPDVGADTWLFYLDPETYRMVGYRFYHVETDNDGEYITLEDEYQLGDLRLPQTRTWYMNIDDRLLGTDRLVSHGE